MSTTTPNPDPGIDEEHTTPSRRLPIGAEVQAGGVHFRVWAPKCRHVEVLFEWGPKAGPEKFDLEPEDNGYFSGLVRSVGDGARYRFRLDEGDAYPDPASRYQPEGPHGPSQVVDPNLYGWGDDAWSGLVLEGQVMYELHLGTAAGRDPRDPRRL